MFDILVFLFEHYVRPDACPGTEQLARKLSAAGFEDEEISEALAWLDALREPAVAATLIAEPRPGSIRLYAPDEASVLDADCRGFIAFLEAAGVLDAGMRELVIERALALTDFTLNLYRLKVIVLIVMWQREKALDTLILDELLTGDEDEEFVVLQ